MSNIYVFLLLVLSARVCEGDFMCVCNYNVEKPVYPSESTKDTLLGYLYEFDCKPKVGNTTDPGWLSIVFQNQIAYIEKDDQTDLQACPGEPPNEDKLTSSVSGPPTTAASATVTTTEVSAPPSSPGSAGTATSVRTTSSTMSTTTTATLPSTTTLTTSTIPFMTDESTTVSEPFKSTKQSTTAKVTTVTSSTTPSTTTTVPTSKPSTSKETSTLPTTGDLFSVTTLPTTIAFSSTVPTTSELPTTSTSSSSIMPSSTTSTVPSSTAPASTVKVSYGCADKFIQATSQEHGTLFTYGHNCYEIVPTPHSFRFAENDCQRRGGHLAHITNSSEQAAVYQVVDQYHGDHVWIGLHDEDREEHFVWTSGDPVTYTNWLPGRKDFLFHAFENCVSMRVGRYGGKWEDLDCDSRYAYICDFDAVATTHAVTTSAPNADGDTHLCPGIVQRAADTYGNIIGQHGDSCYELRGTKTSWTNSESLCKRRGGHLVQIQDVSEQSFIQKFLMRHDPNYAVWIGLHDIYSEGSFEWTSGESVGYTNWIAGHQDNFVDHRQEDCVVLVPYKGGVWDDIPCGDRGGTHLVLCEYKSTSDFAASVLIG